MSGEEDLLGISKFLMAAAAIFNFSKYAFLIEQLRSIADSQHPIKFDEDWSNSEDMATDFQNSRRRRPPS